MPISIYPCTREYLTGLVSICRKNRELEPSLKLQINYDRGRRTFRVSEKKDGRATRRYLSPSDPIFPKLVSKYCAEKILAAVLQTRQKRGVTVASAFDELDKSSERLEEIFGAACPDYVRSRKTILAEWRSESYNRNGYEFKPDTNYKTSRGETVRSKTEVIIADILDRLEIPYKIEYPVSANGHTVYPDFVFVIPTTGRLYYLEAFGCMDDPGYVEKTIRKIRDYAKCGITFGDNFIATFECASIPFDADAFRETIKALM